MSASLSGAASVRPLVTEEDARSELGALFETAPPVGGSSVGAPGRYGPEGGTVVGAPSFGGGGGPSRGGGTPIQGVTRAAPVAGRVVGRGPVPVDTRKFRYDRTRADTLPALGFSASKADRMDAAEAGAMLQRIHEMYGIDRDSEDVIAAFDKALFFEHTINGASLLQPGRGKLFVADTAFELQLVKTLMGADQRRFFRAFADDIADVNREVLASYDAYDAVAAEKYGQLLQVAVERGLQKYPHLAHDSSDAGVRLSVEERVAVMASKRSVLASSVNKVDEVVERPGQAAGH